MTRPARVLGPAALAAVAGAIALAPAASAAPASPAPASPRCHPGQLAAKLVPGSPGAGQRYATLLFVHRAGRTCRVFGYPGLRLLARSGRPLPTNVTRDQTTRPKTVVLPPGGRAAALLHWGAIPGPGEPTTRPCQPSPARALVTLPDQRAHLAVRWRGGPVCQKGLIDVGPLRRRR